MSLRKPQKSLQEDKKQSPNGVHKISKKTFQWDEIPAWMRDNEYIISGYRGELKSWKSCLSSAFTYIHNESVNIHSHYIGGIIFFTLLFSALPQMFSQYHQTMTLEEKLYMLFFMAGAITCLSMSATYHMLSCHSLIIHRLFHRLDYSGIVFLTVGSFYPAVHYAFYCSPNERRFWHAVLTIFGLAAAYVVLSPTYSSSAYRRHRTAIFIALGLGGALPTIHAFYVDGYDHLATIGVNWLLLSGTLYIAGALFYAERFPERFFPGKFDLFFSSHQIFHIAVVSAAVCHYLLLRTSLAYWHGVRKGQCNI